MERSRRTHPHWTCMYFLIEPKKEKIFNLQQLHVHYVCSVPSRQFHKLHVRVVFRFHIVCRHDHLFPSIALSSLHTLDYEEQMPSVQLQQPLQIILVRSRSIAASFRLQVFQANADANPTSPAFLTERGRRTKYEELSSMHSPASTFTSVVKRVVESLWVRTPYSHLLHYW